MQKNFHIKIFTYFIFLFLLLLFFNNNKVLAEYSCGNNFSFVYNSQNVSYETVKIGDLCWMKRNLGSDRVCQSYNDHECYGDLFQWGRSDDGHQLINWFDSSLGAFIYGTIAGPETNAKPDSNFITVNNDPFDWLSPQNASLWDGEAAINNPCPLGWRLPTEAELISISSAWNNNIDAFNSSLKFPSSGLRLADSTLVDVSLYGYVWSSNISGTASRRLGFSNADSYMHVAARAQAASVRCVRNLNPLNTFSLNVSVNPIDAGVINVNPVGLFCGDNCYSYNDGDNVTLSVSTNLGYSFTGWGGDCSGTGNCILLMNSDKTAIANFLLVDPDPDPETTLPEYLYDSQEKDAIALRVLPNPNNYSIERWYKFQGFTGSPQTIIVDGYQAIRDGRTVYVNAANVVDNNLYTNIYLITHTQDPDVKTLDIFSRLIDSWKFNTNLTSPGECSIPGQVCISDSDCKSNLVCQSNRCLLPPGETMNCLIDTTCPDSLYCNSDKAKVTRDVRRLGLLADMNESLRSYYQRNGHFPILGAGTYIRHKAVSTWPSWQNLFLSEINMSSSYRDPINLLGQCEGYDLITCWDEEANSFYDSGETKDELVLPEGSHAIVYESNFNGSDYNICSSFETTYNILEGSLIEKTCLTTGIGYEGEVDHSAPILMNYNLDGQAKKEFSGFIRVTSPTNNPLNWNINLFGDFSSWSEAPVLQTTNNPNLRRVYSPEAGDIGDYNISLHVLDTVSGLSLSEDLTIRLAGSVPFIEITNNIDYHLNPNNPLSFSAKITDSYTPVTANFISDPDYNLFSGLSTSQFGNILNLEVENIVSTAYTFEEDTTVSAELQAINNLGVESTRNFNINLLVTKPILDFVCPPQIRANYHYYCLLGSKYQGDFTISYQADNLPDGIEIKEGFVFNPCGEEFTYNGKNYIPIYKDGLCWLDRNLGATRACTALNDEDCYGYYFQWGRGYDGHQEKNSGHTPDKSNTDDPGHEDFITGSIDDPDWRVPKNDELWQGVDGINNPCPEGWRVPTIGELEIEMNSWVAENNSGAFNSILAWPSTGRRDPDGTYTVIGSSGRAWSSTINGDYSQWIFFNVSTANTASHLRVRAYPVRCVKDLPAGLEPYYVLEGSSTDFGNHDVSITALNDYGTKRTRDFNLKVTSYCGDGVKQEPNMEERGGPYNDGYEQCDGEDGVTNNPLDSSPSLQYGCNMGPNWPEPDNNKLKNGYYCTYPSPINGGGYCGDDICQDIENCSNCPADCGVCEYTVTYNANDATSGSAPADQIKTHDVDLTLQTNTGNLKKTGYIFDGWNTLANGNGTNYAAGANYTLNSNLNLFAKWQEEEEEEEEEEEDPPPPPPKECKFALGHGSCTQNYGCEHGLEGEFSDVHPLQFYHPDYGTFYHPGDFLYFSCYNQVAYGCVGDIINNGGALEPQEPPPYCSPSCFACLPSVFGSCCENPTPCDLDQNYCSVETSEGACDNKSPYCVWE